MVNDIMFNDGKPGFSPWTYTKRMLIGGLVILGGILLFTPSDAGATSLKQIIDSTTRVHINGRFACSANFIGSDDEGDYFLTAAHCVPEKPKNGMPESDVTLNWITKNPDNDYEMVSEKSYFVDAVRTYRDDDVAVYKTRTKVDYPLLPIDLATKEQVENTEIGDKVMAVGFPKGLEISVTFGTFTGQVQSLNHPKGEVWRADPGVTGGSSGGGFYIEVDEDDYALVGVTSAGWRDAQFMNYFTTPDSMFRITQNLMEDTPKSEVIKANLEMEEFLAEIADNIDIESARD